MGQPFYVSALSNIRYLTGFSGSAGHLLVVSDEAVLYTDGRYRTQAKQQTSGIGVEISSGDSRIAFVQDIGRRGLSTLAFEQNRLDYATYAYLASELPHCDLIPRPAVVEDLRLIKSPSEIEAIRRSVQLNSEAFEAACSKASAGVSETWLAAQIEYEMRMRGAAGAAFPTIVASGAHGALPHAEPRDVAVRPKALVVVDQGAILDGYCSDMTRMIALGGPATSQRKLVNAVAAAQAAAIEAVRPGVECRTVDRRARQALKAVSIGGVRLDKAFTHSTGHGLGLEIHEGPRIAPRQRQKLRAGMVITIEPGSYIEGMAGARIEDVVLVTSTGCEILTSTSHELRVL